MSMYEKLKNYKSIDVDFLYDENNLLEIRDKSGVVIDTIISDRKSNLYNNKLIYSYIETLDKDSVLELGIGAGSIPLALKDITFTKDIIYVEVNKNICEHFKNINILNENIITYLKNNVLSNTVFSFNYYNSHDIKEIFDIENDIIDFIVRAFYKQINKNNIFILRIRDYEDLINVSKMSKLNIVNYIKGDKCHIISISL